MDFRISFRRIQVAMMAARPRGPSIRACGFTRTLRAYIGSAAAHLFSIAHRITITSIRHRTLSIWPHAELFRMSRGLNAIRAKRTV